MNGVRSYTQRDCFKNGSEMVPKLLREYFMRSIWLKSSRLHKKVNLLLHWHYSLMRAFASIMHLLHISGFLTGRFLRVQFSTPRPTPNLEEQVPIFFNLGAGVVQLYPYIKYEWLNKIKYNRFTVGFRSFHCFVFYLSNI